MQVLIVFGLLVAASSAQLIVNPWTLGHSLTWGGSLVAPRVVQPYITAPAFTIPTSSQYRVQDELGQFAFGHRGDNQARDEVKSFDGSVRGAYSYVDPTGKLINVQYLADHNGYRVLGANNLPVAPEVPAVVELKGPEPVSDTAEVIAARANFAKEFAKVTGEVEKMKMDEKEEMKKEEEKKERRAVPLTRTVPLTTVVHPSLINPLITHPVVPLTKSILKTSEFKTVDAKTPAATKKAEIEVKEHEVISPWGIHPWATPVLTRTIELEKKDDKEEEKKEIKEFEKKIFSPLPLTSTFFL